MPSRTAGSVSRRQLRGVDDSTESGESFADAVSEWQSCAPWRGDAPGPLLVDGLQGPPRTLPMKVRDIMTEPPLTCSPETSLAVAAHLMQEADYGTLPVVDARGMVVGIVTDRDICLALARTNRNAVNIAVREVMTTTVVSARPGDEVRGALATMKVGRVRRLPVRDEAGRLIVMLSIEDIVLRGLQGDGVGPDDLVAALRAMYVRTPVRVEAGSWEGFTPG